MGVIEITGLIPGAERLSLSSLGYMDLWNGKAHHHAGRIVMVATDRALLRLHVSDLAGPTIGRGLPGKFSR